VCSVVADIVTVRKPMSDESNLLGLALSWYFDFI